jgi:hypothetical protein
VPTRCSPLCCPELVLTREAMWPRRVDLCCFVS